MRGRIWLAGAIAVCGLCLGTAALADSSDEQFLAGLRQRRLFALIESYCREKLNRPELPANDRALLAAELSRVFVERAIDAEPAAAANWWDQALAAARQPVAGASPEATLALQVQAARTLLARGEWERELAAATGRPQALVETARERLLEAIKSLERAQEGAKRSVAWQQELRKESARAYRNLALWHVQDGPDKTAALSKAVELLAPLGQMPASDPTTWSARLEEARCYRLLKDFPAANIRLGQLLSQPLPPELAAGARAEQLQLALAMGRGETALAILDATADTLVSGVDLDLAAVTVLAAARGAALASKQTTEAAEYERRARKTVDDLRRRFGAHAARRAEALLASVSAKEAEAGTSSVGEMDRLVRDAEEFLRRRQYEAATETYDRARALAISRGDARQAFQFALAAANIEHERQAHRAAADRFRRLAMSQPKHERAPEAHLSAIFNAAQEARRHEPVNLDEYAELVEEHLKTWPTGKTADQAHWLQGKLKEHAGDWEAAAAAYWQVSPDHAQYAAAIEAGAACQRKLIEAARAAGRPLGPLVTAAAVRAEAAFLTAGNRLPEKWSPAQRTAATSAARLWLSAEPPDYARAERVLRSALADPNGASPAWIDGAQGLLACALAGQGKLPEARALLERLAAGSPQETLLLLESLSQLGGGATGSSGELAALQLQAVEKLGSRRDELDAAALVRFARLEAKAFAAAGRREQALAAYAALASQHSQDGDVQEEYATLLSAGNDKPSLDAALSKWRELEQKSRPGTQRWFRAKYQLALLHERLGNKAQAAKIAALTQVLHPDLGGAELKAKFEQLLARCKTRP